MRRIAASLGVDVAALYWHFKNKDALLDALAETAAQQAEIPLPEGGPWRERAVALCRAIHQRLIEHPELALQVRSPWLAPFLARATGRLARILSESGLAADQVLYASHALLHVVTAVAASKAAAADSSADEVRRFMRDLAAELPPALIPDWIAMARQDAATGFRDYFDTAVGLVLDGLEQRTAAEPSTG
jgi:TetR/AcrR family tetracycline transcriptional repressor